MAHAVNIAIVPLDGSNHCNHTGRKKWKHTSFARFIRGYFNMPEEHPSSRISNSGIQKLTHEVMCHLLRSSERTRIVHVGSLRSKTRKMKMGFCKYSRESNEMETAR